MGKILKALALFVGFGVAQNAAAASLLVNGAFEEPAQGAPDYAAFNVGTQYSTTYITGWTVTQGNVDLTTTANYGPGPNTLDLGSVQDVDLIGDTTGSNGVKGGISQSFSTVAGQTYLLTFDYSHNNGNYSPNGYAALVTVADGNAPPGSSIFSTTVSQAYITGVGFPSGGWQAFSQDFTATSALTMLSFIDTQGAFNAGIYLDDVSVDVVNATPIPGALPLFAGGAGVLGFFGWRRKKKSAALAA
jgi:Protein of unknown function (DUF642)